MLMVMVMVMASKNGWAWCFFLLSDVTCYPRKAVPPPHVNHSPANPKRTRRCMLCCAKL